mmetsp:Transcript_23429/g.61345  ORF Transcript_23429/g.61345 Transcript_23429/m.61345 type:complete len:301 (-) Transcript_23429:261-1163(-)
MSVSGGERDGRKVGLRKLTSQQGTRTVVRDGFGRPCLVWLAFEFVNDGDARSLQPGLHRSARVGGNSLHQRVNDERRKALSRGVQSGRPDTIVVRQSHTVHLGDSSCCQLPPKHGEGIAGHRPEERRVRVRVPAVALVDDDVGVRNIKVGVELPPLGAPDAVIRPQILHHKGGFGRAWISPAAGRGLRGSPRPRVADLGRGERLAAKVGRRERHVPGRVGIAGVHHHIKVTPPQQSVDWVHYALGVLDCQRPRHKVVLHIDNNQRALSRRRPRICSRARLGIVCHSAGRHRWGHPREVAC